MPIPKPQSNESKSEYIERCMSNETMKNEYEQSQRSAICYQQWRDKEDVGDSMDKELRVDEGKIKDWRYDEGEEVLVADVLMTKSQVLPYKDGKDTVYELLPPNELSEDEWLDSAKSKAVTDLHPDEEVNYENLGDHSKGSITNKVWTEEKDDGTIEVWAKETVYDQDLIQEIRDGQKEQVSIGRFVEVIDESGEFNGTTYDRKQTNFKLNHLAHVPQGRAGSDVSVRLDGDSIVAETEDDNSVSITNEGDSKPNKTANQDEVRDMKLTIGDKELELDEDLEEDTVEEFQDEIDERLHELREKDDELDEKESKLDEKDEKLGKLEGRLDSLEEKVDKDVTEDKINEKLALIEDVKQVMPDYDWRGKTSTEMKADVIKAVFDNVDLEEKSEAYIEGRYDAAIERAKEVKDNKITMKPDREDDGEQSEIDELRSKRIEKFQG